MKPIFILSPTSAQRIARYLEWITIGLFAFAVLLLAWYQLSYVLQANPSMPFFEPDNYEYYLFVQLALAHHSLNVSNPYLMFPSSGFFEHPGLLALPYALASIGVPVVWSFRILQLLAVLAIYALSLLLLDKIIDHLPIGRIYRYLSYTMVLTSFFLMQYTEIIEWRGNEFAVALELVVLYCLAYAMTNRVGFRKLLLLAAVAIGSSLAAIWIWSGGYAVGISGIAVGGLLLFYKHALKQHPLVWRWVALAVVLFSIIFFFAYAQIDNLASGITQYFVGTACQYNPLQLGEVECLNLSNGLLAVLMMLVFGSLALAAYLGKTIETFEKSSYEYYLVGIFGMILVQLPLAFDFIRLLSLVAPFLAILYALGVVAMLSYFNKLKSNRIVVGINVVLILLAGFIGQYLFYSTNAITYSLINPSGLVGVGSYLSAYPNSSVLTYYSYGDWLEAYGHVRVYGDTIQELNRYLLINATDNAFLSNPAGMCSFLGNFSLSPDFVLLSTQLNESVLFQNASSSSLVKAPLGFNGSCGYRLAYQGGGFYLFKYER